MSEPNVYELLHRQIEGGFERTDVRLEQVLAQQRLTNGRVKDAEIRLAVHESQLTAGSSRMEVLSKRSHDLSQVVQVLPQLQQDVVACKDAVVKLPKLLEDVGRIDMRVSGLGVSSSASRKADRKITERDVWLALVGVTATIGVLKFLSLIGVPLGVLIQ